MFGETRGKNTLFGNRFLELVSDKKVKFSLNKAFDMILQIGESRGFM